MFEKIAGVCVGARGNHPGQTWEGMVVRPFLKKLLAQGRGVSPPQQCFGPSFSAHRLLFHTSCHCSSNLPSKIPQRCAKSSSEILVAIFGALARIRCNAHPVRRPPPTPPRILQKVGIIVPPGISELYKYYSLIEGP